MINFKIAFIPSPKYVLLRKTSKAQFGRKMKMQQSDYKFMKCIQPKAVSICE